MELCFEKKGKNVPHIFIIVKRHPVLEKYQKGALSYFFYPENTIATAAMAINVEQNCFNLVKIVTHESLLYQHTFLPIWLKLLKGDQNPSDFIKITSTLYVIAVTAITAITWNNLAKVGGYNCCSYGRSCCDST